MLDRLLMEAVVEAALREDVGTCDLTSEIVIPAQASARFMVNSRNDIVVAGIDAMIHAFKRRCPDLRAELLAADGERLARGARIAIVEGRARDLLTAERTALNFIQHLSGIATLTATYVARIAGTTATLVDTRKTTPGLRALEKHAVSLGGARNHRLGLDDGIMIKDNHISVCGSIAAAVATARAKVPLLTKIEVECDKVEQVGEALAAGADVIMLDNMSLDDLRRAVALVGGKVPLEASGGVTLETIRAIAETGVDFISVSRITQSAPAVDIGLDAEIRG
jgi:nicotinate-nucleotide pyrophosphorylase (carboxylating)